MFDRGPIMTEEERVEFYNWCIKILPNVPRMTFNRKTYYFNTGNDKLVLLDKIYEIKQRIEDKENLHEFEKDVVLHDFIGYVMYDGYIHKHTDDNDGENIHVRFNVFISIPNFNTYYSDKIVDAIEGSYVLCRSGIDLHYSDVNPELKPRIALSFGYSLPKWKMNELCKEKKELYNIYI